MVKIDNYSIRARIYPIIIVLTPFFIMAVFHITNVEKYYHYFTAVISLGIISFVLSQIGRDQGKKKEPSLFKYFGGKPTTVLLRHRNNFLDPYTKRRYHQKLSQLLSDISIPNAQDELINPIEADYIYDSCAKYLITQTRNIEEANLLYKENVAYGFRWNLWGLKPFALIALIICLGLHVYDSMFYFTSWISVSFGEKVVGGCFIVGILIWIFGVTKKWVKIPAFAYAERLYESLNKFP